MKILLNGESIRTVGFNVVPEDRFTGNTLPFERIKEDIDLMKSCGANFARMSHVSLPKEFLDYLDEKGIMVFEEVGLWGKDELVDPDKEIPKEWLRRIIEEKYNHPSVVGWSVGNEIGNEANNPKVKAYVKGAIEMAKQLDPNRWAVYVSNTAQRSSDDAAMYNDITMVNFYGGWGKGAVQAWANHKKPVFVSEFGDALNDEDPNLGIIPIEKMMNQMRSKNYVFGVSLWTFNDYRSTYFGKTGWVTPPSQNRPWGIVSTFREKKRSFYDVQREYAPVKNLNFSAIDQAKGAVTITIEPRGTLDIPVECAAGVQTAVDRDESAF
jgi:beta-galactosidase